MVRKAYRKFDGKRFELFLQTNSKRRSQGAKKNLKRSDHLVRIVSGLGGYKYAVYYRERKGKWYR